MYKRGLTEVLQAMSNNLQIRLMTEKLLLSSEFDATFPVMKIVFIWSLFGYPVVNCRNISATFTEGRDYAFYHSVDILFAFCEDTLVHTAEYCKAGEFLACSNRIATGSDFERAHYIHPDFIDIDWYHGICQTVGVNLDIQVPLPVNLPGSQI